jgi:MYXO-CTERM domain-containing protein
MPRLADLRPSFPVCLVLALGVATPGFAATLYDEDVGGDLTADESAAPNVGTLAEGESSVFGSMTDFGDAFRVTLGPGLEIVAVDVLVSGYVDTAFGAGRARFSEDDFSDIDEFDFDASGNYSFDGLPVPSAVYLFKIFGFGELLPTYDWEVRLTVPEPAGGALAALAVLAAGAWRRRRTR